MKIYKRKNRPFESTLLFPIEFSLIWQGLNVLFGICKIPVLLLQFKCAIINLI